MAGAIESGGIILLYIKNKVADRRLIPQSRILSLVHVRNLHPVCIFGHVNGVLSICTRVQICSCLRGGANLFTPGCKFAPGCKLCT